MVSRSRKQIHFGLSVFAGVLLLPCVGLAQDTSMQAQAEEVLHEIVNEFPFDPQYWWEGEGALSYLGEISSKRAVAGTLGYGGKLGARWGDWGLFLQAEHNMWVLTNVGHGPIDSVLNLGGGGEILFFEGRVKTSFSFGTSIALFSTLLDDFGSAGFYVEARPLTYRLPLDEGVFLCFEPIGAITMVPITEGIPLVQLAYRSVIGAEVTF